MNPSTLVLTGLLSMAPIATALPGPTSDEPQAPLAGDVIPRPRAVEILEEVQLGGVGQWILVRGQSIQLPILLVLHGGPGAPQMPWVDSMQAKELEEHFLVVHWDQRGAGKSFDPRLTVDDLRVENLVGDTLELSQLLRKRFKQEKIFLTGHSWGSALGFLAIARDSQPFHAYIASGERVDWKRSHQLAYQWSVRRARELKEHALLEQLEAIRPFNVEVSRHVEILHGALERLGGGDFSTPGLWEEMLRYLQAGESPYYTLEEVRGAWEGLRLCSEAIEPYARTYDLHELLPRSSLPVHFLQGEHDHNTPEALSRGYFEALVAPDKTYTVIEGAGHSMMYDRPRAWARALIRIKDRTLAE